MCRIARRFCSTSIRRRIKIRTVSDWADPDGRLGIAGRAIEDPHGGTLDDYRRVRDELRSMMRGKLDGK